MRLLIIEDSPLVRRWYGLALSRREHERLDAENGRLALDLLTASAEPSPGRRSCSNRPEVSGLPP